MGDRTAMTSSDAIQRNWWKLAKSGMGFLFAMHTGATYVDKNRIDNASKEPMIGPQRNPEEKPRVILRLRATPAFFVSPYNPAQHVFLTTEMADLPETRVGERGSGREDWKDVSIEVKSMEITADQADELWHKNLAMKNAYMAALYGPMWNDCHTWVETLQKNAGIEEPMSTPRFSMPQKKV